MSDVRDDAHGTSVARQLSLPLGQAQRKRGAADVCNNEGIAPGNKSAAARRLAEGQIQAMLRDHANMAFGQTIRRIQCAAPRLR